MLIEIKFGIDEVVWISEYSFKGWEPKSYKIRSVIITNKGITYNLNGFQHKESDCFYNEESCKLRCEERNSCR